MSITRSTRFGPSAGIDLLGRIQARRSSFEGSDRVLIRELPRRGRVTWSRRTGDVLVLLSGPFLLAAVGVPYCRACWG